MHNRSILSVRRTCFFQSVDMVQRSLQRGAEAARTETERRLHEATKHCADLQQELADMGLTHEKVVAEKKELERILTAREKELETRGLAMQQLTLRGKRDAEELERLGAERDSLLKELEASKSREADLRAQRRPEVEVRESKEPERGRIVLRGDIHHRGRLKINPQKIVGFRRSSSGWARPPHPP